MSNWSSVWVSMSSVTGWTSLWRTRVVAAAATPCSTSTQEPWRCLSSPSCYKAWLTRLKRRCRLPTWTITPGNALQSFSASNQPVFNFLTSPYNAVVFPVFFRVGLYKLIMFTHNAFACIRILLFKISI